MVVKHWHVPPQFAPAVEPGDPGPEQMLAAAAAIGIKAEAIIGVTITAATP
jgi:hypothetical protein